MKNLLRIDILSLLIVTLSISSCISEKKLISKAEDAHQYYKKAIDALSRTSSNLVPKEGALLALEFANKAVTLNPKVSAHFRVRGSAYRHLKQYTLAIENYTKAIKLDSTNQSAWIGIGLTYNSSRKFNLAEESYFKALTLDGNKAIIYNNIGLLYNNWNKLDKALGYFTKAINIKQDTNYYLNRGHTKILKGAYADAIKDFDISISLKASNVIAYNNRGLCKSYLKDYKGAIFDLKRSLDIGSAGEYKDDDIDTYAYNNIANAYFALKDTSNACIYWQKAIDNDYKYQREWKEQYGIDDPVELIKQHCN